MIAEGSGSFPETCDNSDVYPSSSLRTVNNQFTSELVQFSSVEQQIDTNTSLTQLIQLTQGSEVM